MRKLCDMATKLSQKKPWCKFMMMMTFMKVKGHQRLNVVNVALWLPNLVRKNPWCKFMMVMTFMKVRGHQRSNVVNFELWLPNLVNRIANASFKWWWPSRLRHFNECFRLTLLCPCKGHSHVLFSLCLSLCIYMRRLIKSGYAVGCFYLLFFSPNILHLFFMLTGYDYPKWDSSGLIFLFSLIFWPRKTCLTERERKKEKGASIFSLFNLLQKQHHKIELYGKSNMNN